MRTTFVNTLMPAEADAVCGAEYGACSSERTNAGNGYRHRDFETRAGTLEVAIPKLRSTCSSAGRSPPPRTAPAGWASSGI